VACASIRRNKGQINSATRGHWLITGIDPSAAPVIQSARVILKASSFPSGRPGTFLVFTTPRIRFSGNTKTPLPRRFIDSQGNGGVSVGKGSLLRKKGGRNKLIPTSTSSVGCRRCQKADSKGADYADQNQRNDKLNQGEAELT